MLTCWEWVPCKTACNTWKFLNFCQKSGESSSQLSQEQKSVFDEDLQKKIEENERLHIQVSNSQGISLLRLESWLYVNCNGENE